MPGAPRKSLFFSLSPFVVLRSPDFVIRPVKQSPHIGNTVSISHAVVGISSKPRIVIGNQRGCTTDLTEGFHHLVHIEVAIVLKCFMEARKRRADITKVDGEDLTASAEVLDHPENVFAHL